MNIIDAQERDERIDRYLKGQLQGEELAAFEILMMEDPALFEQVQVVDALKQGLQREQAKLLQDSGAKAHGKSATILPFRFWLRQPLSLAASLLVAVLGFGFVRSEFFMSAPQQAAPDTVATLAPSLGIGGVVLLEASRGDTPLQFSGAAPYLFQIDAGLGNDAEHFTVILQNSAKQELLKQTKLKADADGWVRVVLNQALSGDYQLSLQWTDHAGAAQTREFPINIGQ